MKSKSNGKKPQRVIPKAETTGSGHVDPRRNKMKSNWLMSEAKREKAKHDMPKIKVPKPI